jgi:putative membrane protein insertion efficiency factor
MPPLLEQLPGGTTVVVRAMPEAAAATSDALRGDLERALQRVAPLSPPAVSPDDESRGVDLVEQPPAAVVRPAGWRRVLWWAGWPLRTVLLGLIWVYRHTISPILPPTCRYHPSCSAYGFQALQVHGAAKGSVLTAWRVLRCNPFTPGGLDPVPPRGAWRPDIEPDGTPRVTGGAAA